MLRATRLFVRVGFEALERAAEAHAVDAGTLYDVARGYWRATDAAPFASSTGHHRRPSRVGPPAGTRPIGLRAPAAARGGQPGAHLGAAPRHGLDPARSYFVIRMRPVKPGQHLERLLAVISPGALLDVLDGDLVAVLAQVPDLSPHAYVGAGGPEAPESLAEAYLAAGRALKAAVALDLAQPIHERDAPLEVALASDRGTGELAERRCFGSVPPRTIERLDLERTLQCLLDAELRIDPAARTLHLHPNTLRHRVARFEQETGLRLSRPRDAALVWWALGHRRASANRHPRGYY